MGLTTDDFVLATGSSAHDVRRGAEQLPGRRGKGLDLVHLPMSFRDFCRVAGGAEVPDETLLPEECLTASGRELLREAYLEFDSLERAFRSYCQTGGFPPAVSDTVSRGEVTEAAVQTLWRTLSGDVARRGLSQTAAVKLLERVSISLGSRLAWTSAAEAMNVDDPKTAKRYAEFLAEAFSLLIVHFWDLSGGTLRPRKLRKVYFIDPLLSRIPTVLMPGARDPAEEALVENRPSSPAFTVGDLQPVESASCNGASDVSTPDREIRVSSNREVGRSRRVIELLVDLG